MTRTPWTPKRNNHCPHCLCPGHERRKGNAAPELVEALEGCVESQECNGYIGLQMLTEVRILLARVRGERGES